MKADTPHPTQQTDLIQSFFRFLPIWEVFACATVCKEWNRASNNPVRFHPARLRVDAEADGTFDFAQYFSGGGCARLLPCISPIQEVDFSGYEIFKSQWLKEISESRAFEVTVMITKFNLHQFDEYPIRFQNPCLYPNLETLHFSNSNIPTKLSGLCKI